MDIRLRKPRQKCCTQRQTNIYPIWCCDKRQWVLYNVVTNDWTGFNDGAALEDFTRAGLNILESGIIERVEGDRLVLFGHSVGSLAAWVSFPIRDVHRLIKFLSIWVASLYQERGHLLDALIVAEPPGEIFSKEPIAKQNSEAFIPLTKNWKDIWASKEEAFAWLSSKQPYKAWDKRVLQAYVVCSLSYGFMDSDAHKNTGPWTMPPTDWRISRPSGGRHIELPSRAWNLRV